MAAAYRLKLARPGRNCASWAAWKGNELDLIRVRWLEGRVEAGQGRRVQAAAAFTQVRTEFAARGMGFDAALATLDLAVNMGRIFKTKGIGREALAAFSLFCDAARQEIETARRSGRS